jgi:hypothetical protein
VTSAEAETTEAAGTQPAAETTAPPEGGADAAAETTAAANAAAGGETASETTEAAATESDPAIESQIGLRDVLSVKTPEGADSGKSCQESLLELRIALNNMAITCPASLLLQCPNYCRSTEAMAASELEIAAPDQMIEPLRSREVVWLIGGTLATVLMLYGLYSYKRSKGDSLDVEYLLVEDQYIDEF